MVSRQSDQAHVQNPDYFISSWKKMLKILTWRTFGCVWLFFEGLGELLPSQALSEEGLDLPEEEQKGNR